jgi:hypothetical protein|tara:strand:+ start:1823 stop:2296 length:474 start_codon:yes stop_codon:yes gene_type:complete
MTKIDKTSRSSEDRSKKEAPKSWTPSSSLDAPDAPHGFSHRWIRTTIQGFDDATNVSRKLREGWEFVTAATLISEIGDSHGYPVLEEGKHRGLIGIGGLVLARIPTEILEQRAAYFKRLTDDRMKAVDSDLMKEQHPEMPINIERQSRVTFGGRNKK